MKDLININNNEKLFWKVFLNKFLFNKILDSFESKSFNSIKYYYPLNKIKFKSINTLDFMVRHSLWNLLLDKIESNQFIQIDSENSFVAFLCSFRQQHNFFVVEKFYKYMKRNNIKFKGDPIISSIKAFSTLAIRLFSESGIYLISDDHYQQDISLSNLEIFKELIRIDNDGESMSMELKKSILRKVIQFGEYSEPVLQFILDNPKFYITLGRNGNSDDKILLYYFSKLKNLELKYRVMELDWISPCDRLFFLFYFVNNTLAVDQSIENLIFIIKLYYKVVEEIDEPPTNIKEKLKLVEQTNDGIDGKINILFDIFNQDLKYTMVQTYILNKRNQPEPSSSSIPKKQKKVNKFEIYIKHEDYINRSNYIINLAISGQSIKLNLLLNSLSNCNIENIKQIDSQGNKYDVLLDYIEKSPISLIVEEPFIQDEELNLNNHYGNINNGDDDDGDDDDDGSYSSTISELQNYDEYFKPREEKLKSYYKSLIKFKVDSIESIKTLIQYLNQSGYKSFSDSLFKVFIIQLVNKYTSKLLLEENIQIDFNLFSETTTQLLIFYSVYLDFKMSQYITSNSTFKFDSSIDKETIDQIIKTQDFDYFIYSNEEEPYNIEMESIEIISGIQLLIKYFKENTNHRDLNYLSSLFNHLYRKLLQSLNVSYSEVLMIRNSFKQENIGIIEDHFTTFYYLYIRSNKFLFYILNNQQSFKILEELDTDLYNCSKDYTRISRFNIKHCLDPKDFPFTEIFASRFSNENFKIIYFKLKNNFSIYSNLNFNSELYFLLSISRFDLLLELIKDHGSIKFKLNDEFFKLLNPNDLNYLFTLNNFKFQPFELQQIKEYIEKDKRDDLKEIFNIYNK